MATYQKNFPGAPTSGFHSVGDVVIDSVGVAWECVEAGLPGKFVASPRNARTQRVISAEGTPTSVATVGAAPITAAMVLSGIYVRDCAGAGRTDTLPTAELLVAAVPNAQVGDVIRLHVVNGSDAAEVLTLAAGAGGAFDTNQVAASRVVPQNVSKDIHIRLTNVTAAAEAYVVYA